MTSRRWLPPALWAALILVLTSIPAPPDLTAGIPLLHLDKVVHFLLYAGQGWLVTRALRTRRPRSLLAALLGIAVFGAFDEWHQHLFARTPSLVDWIADVIGASVGVAFASRVHRVETAQ